MILPLIKIAAVLTTAFFGIRALKTNYRDKKTGKRTSASKTALTGLIVSAALSVTIEIVQYIQEERKEQSAEAEAHKAQLQAEALAANTRRLLRPFSEVHFQFSIAVNKDDPIISNDLSSIAYELLADAPDQRILAAYGAEIIKRGDRPRFVMPTGAPIISRIPKSEKLIRMIFLDAEWYANSVSREVIVNNPPQPDLQLDCFLMDRDDGHGPFLFFDFSSEEYWIEGEVEKPSLGAKSGRIVSLDDIPGSTIVFRFRDKCPFALKDATISLGEGQDYDIRKFVRVPSRRGDLFVYQFPNDADFNSASQRQILRMYKLQNVPR